MSDDTPKRNRDLFYRIADQIEKEPTSYDQGFWCVTQAEYIEELRFEVEFGDATQEKLDRALDVPASECGTVACVAGWACFLTSGSTMVPLDGWTRSARELLGLSSQEADLLFCDTWKPRPGLTVPEALRKLGDGASVEEVSA